MPTQTLRRRPTAGKHESWRHFGEAARYTHRVHAGQHRPGTDEPYTEHLFRVAIRVIEDGVS